MALNVLVVDDSSITRRMIIKTLDLAGIPVDEVYEAGNGREGLGVLEEHWIDLVLADINMPVMDGEEMINRLRDNPAWADIPLIVVSTEGSETRIERLQQKGVKDFVHKPFQPETIRDVVRKALGGSCERVASN